MKTDEGSDVSEDSVHSVEKSGSDRINKMDKISSKKAGNSDSVNSVDSVENNGSAPRTLPNSKKIYVTGKIHVDLRVPFREIALAPTKTMSGEIEVNEPVRVYDTIGPWSDPAFTGNIEEGLPLVRAKWIHDRGDVEEIAGRIVQPIDDGYLCEMHAADWAKR